MLTCLGIAGGYLLTLAVICVLAGLLAPKLVAGSAIVCGSSIQIKGVAASNTSQKLTCNVTGTPQISLQYGSAAGSGNFNILICEDFTLAASGNQTFNLNTGLNDLFNQAAGTMIHLKYLGVYIVSGGDVSGVTIEGASASNPFVGFGLGSGTGPTIYPSGPGFQAGEPATGLTVSGTVCNVKVLNNSSSASVSLRLIAAGSTY